MLRANRTGLAVVALWMTISACQSEPVGSRHTPLFNENPQTVDEELFGDVYQNGQRTTSTSFEVSLEPFDVPTDNRILNPRSFVQWVNPSADHMYGWWDPAGAGSCGNLAQYAAGQRGAESHSPGPGQQPSGPETHCIRPGQYRFALAGKLFRIDYLQMAGNQLTITNGTAGVQERVENTGYTGQDLANWVDAVVHVDLTPNGFSDSPVLDVENALGDVLRATFSNQPIPQGTEFDYFRFSAARSTSTWNRNPQGSMLARLYWDFNVNKSVGTNYYDAHSTAYVLRHHRFVDHVHESRNVVVALELMRPDEQPDDTINVATRTVAITRTSPIACASGEATSTWLTTDQVLNAGCSSQGSGFEYRWRASATASWSSWSSSPLFEFPGHTSPGSPTVILEVRNTTSGATTQYAMPFSVAGSQIVLNGNQWITAKTTYTYTSNHTQWWYERFDPDPAWYASPEPARDTTARTWYAGNYTVGLRQQTGSGAMGRGRLDITVCIPCGSGGGNPVAPTTVDSSWGIFGAGPWLSWGDGNSLRMFDLLGMHQVASPFTDRGWLKADSGRGSETGAGRLVTWRRRPLGLSAVQAVDFIVDATAGAMTFGFAVDPDLGSNAADDATGYDAARGMVYVWDGQRAVGFLLRDTDGTDALRGVTQYGLNRRHPVASRDVWTAQRRAGVSLLTGRSDVQLLLTAPARQGTLRWTLIMVRGRSLAELREQADSAVDGLS